MKEMNGCDLKDFLRLTVTRIVLDPHAMEIHIHARVPVQENR
jgi:hypothetical protein